MIKLIYLNPRAVNCLDASCTDPGGVRCTMWSSVCVLMDMEKVERVVCIVLVEVRFVLDHGKGV